MLSIIIRCKDVSAFFSFLFFFLFTEQSPASSAFQTHLVPAFSLSLSFSLSPSPYARLRNHTFVIPTHLQKETEKSHYGQETGAINMYLHFRKDTTCAACADTIQKYEKVVACRSPPALHLPLPDSLLSDTWRFRPQRFLSQSNSPH